MDKAFDFGANWSDYSRHALTPEHFAQARRDFARLLVPAGPLEGKTYLDIGFGQGLGTISAGLEGALLYGVDINPKCRDVLLRNAQALAPEASLAPEVMVGSILDPGVVAKLTDWQPQGYDIVHSWGVLHHTGDMWTAISNAISLARPNGIFVLAIYNTHWSSAPWTAIKRAYVHSPKWIQKALNLFFVPVIYLAKLAVTRRNPLTKDRGMDFYYDVVDWIGGYPYEHATSDEITTFLAKDGFELVHFNPAEVPTGCNEYVFRRSV